MSKVDGFDYGSRRAEKEIAKIQSDQIRRTRCPLRTNEALYGAHAASSEADRGGGGLINTKGRPGNAHEGIPCIGRDDRCMLPWESDLFLTCSLRLAGFFMGESFTACFGVVG